MIDVGPNQMATALLEFVRLEVAGRDDVSLFGNTPLSTSHAEYVVVDTQEGSWFPVSPDRQAELLREAKDLGYKVVDQADGTVLLHVAP